MAEASNSQNTSTVTEDITTIQQVKKIYETLENDEKVNIFGPKGVGKTQMAKRVSERAIRENKYDFEIWVFMCRKYTSDTLTRSIARQLFIFPTMEEWEVDDDGKGNPEDDEVEVTEKFIEKLKGKFKEKRILLVLDDVLDCDGKIKTKTSNETNFWLEWDKMFPTSHISQLKTILISRLRREGEDISDKNIVEVKSLPRQVSNSLLLEKLDTQLKKIEKIQNLGKTLIEKVNGGDLPGTVTMIAKGLNYLCRDASGVSMVEKELEEAYENYNVSKLVCMKHDVIPIGVLKDLWWRGDHFFRDSGSVHYSELIAYWILEGYIGSGSMTKMYKKGHFILMELMDCGVLKKQEDGYVFMDKSVIHVDDLYQCVDQTASLGLATLFTSDIEVFGRITYDGGMLKTPRRRKKQSSEENCGQNLQTLLLDGTYFTEHDLLGVLESERKLEVLALFNPTIKSLPKSLDTMEGLRVLVLRGCEFLQEAKLPLKTLEVLEISGGRSLKALRSGFFKNMSNLKSLNLSGLQITYLPQAIYNLCGLRWLIIKDCRKLKKLDSLSKLEHLMVVDLSGNISLDTVDKNFLKFKKLQSLNLSKTLVSTTPLLKNIGELTHLLCRDCTSLGRLRGLTSLTSLQTIDLSGSIEFEEFHDSSLESLRSLRTINLSRTGLDRLPSNISKPRFLYLKSCPNLKRLSCLESLEYLEVLDLSGSKSLNEIEEEFFNDMTHLHVLNLSKTNVTCLPSFSKLFNLRELFISHCPSLVRLQSLESATKLEILDLSHCHALQDIEIKSFEAMTCLKKIDMSETKIKSLPSVSNPQSNLCQLLLKNCRALQNLELSGPLLNLEELNLSGIKFLKPDGAEFVRDISKLRILDLSYTGLKQLPSLLKLTNLTHLSLAGCSFLETDLDLKPLSRIEVLDLSGSSINCLPNLTNSKNLQKLLLKDCSNVEGFSSPEDVKVHDLSKIPDAISALTHLEYLEFPNIVLECSPEEMNQNHWNICMLSDIDKPPVFHSGAQFLQILKKNPFPLETSYHLCAFPVKVEGEIGDRYLHRHELVFRDVYLQTSQFSEYKLNKSLQIRGFKNFPNGIENIIGDVNLLFLIDNELKGLPSGFDASIVNKLMGCWLERCHKIVTLFHEKDKNDNLDLKIPLEHLGLCNNGGLESIYNGKQQFGSFDNLKSLCLDGCPKLTTVFPSSWLPKNLQVVQIKHCEKIVHLSDFGGKLSNLETLHLWDLPELKKMGVSFPSLQNLKIWECPKLKQTEDKFEISRNLKTLWISGATRLKNLHTEYEEINLNSLKLENCSMLEYVISSISPLAYIHTIEIRSCEKLHTLFTNIKNNTTLLNTLQLEDLPMLKTIGAHLPSSVNILTSECPVYNSKG